jgi:uncharacterized protein with FMN-binding domain
LRRALYAIMGTAAATSLLVGLKAHADPNQDPGTPPAADLGAGSAAPAGAGPAPSRTAGAPVAGGGAGAVSGRFAGNRVSTPYGLVSVTLIVTGGKITDVSAVLPTTGQSQQVSGNAGPKLRQQVLSKQNAAIDTVSGATYTSEGYRKSLQSALDKVKRG